MKCWQPSEVILDDKRFLCMLPSLSVLVYFSIKAVKHANSFFHCRRKQSLSCPQSNTVFFFARFKGVLEICSCYFFFSKHFTPEILRKHVMACNLFLLGFSNSWVICVVMTF